MAMQRNRNREHQLTSTDILDRIVDGKVVDAGEYYDRVMLSRQVEILLGMPHKQAPRRVR